MIGDRSLHLCRVIDRRWTFTIPVIADVNGDPFWIVFDDLYTD